MIKFKTHTIIISLGGVIALGTVFFRVVEGWTWLESYFFTVITISTVGYGKLVPVTPLGMIGTTVFIFVGLGVFVVAIQQFALFHMKKREEHTEWLIAQLGEVEDENPDFANEDDKPQACAPAHKPARKPAQ